MNGSQTKNLRYAGIGFGAAAIAFAIVGNWLLALAFVVLAVSFIVNSTKSPSEPED